ERFAAQRQGEREMLDDLRGRPLPGRAVLPFAVRTPPERTEHEVRQLTERFHTRHRVRGRGPLVSTRRHAGNLRVNLLRRHPVAIALVVLLLATAIHPLSPLIDAVTGSTPVDVDLERPVTYVLFAPLSNTLDALTFLSQPRAEWALVVWILALAAWGGLRRSETPLTWRRRSTRALVGPGVLVLLAVAAVLLPRPVPRLTTEGTVGGTVIDYHAHTNASH